MGGENEGATGGGGGFSGGGWGDGNGTTDVTWDNRAEMRVLEDFDDKTWTSANYVAKITGLLYNDLTGARERACRAFHALRICLVDC